jgi:3-methyl-2-oxobutanoate hydroxymethyltransferase
MVRQAHLVADMPFLSYQLSKREAVRNAGRLLQAGAQSVKIEGGKRFCELVSELTDVGIPVMGHLGMTPQSVHQMGGFRLQGRDAAHRDRLLCDAKRLEEAGAYAIVLESIPADLAGEITAALEIPTIGIGAGRDCDGQILVIYDLLGIDSTFQPKFVKRYANLSETIQGALKNYSKEVREGIFPDQSHSYENH